MDWLFLMQNGSARSFMALGLLAIVARCSPDTPSNSQPTVATLYGTSIRRIALEVDYASGAEPYTDMNAWDLFRTNATRLFDGSGKTLEVPTALSQMEAINVAGSDFTSAQLMDLSRAHRQRPSAGDTATFHVLFLNAYFNDGTRRRTDVLGVHIDGAGVIAVFKPAVATSVQGSLPYIARVIEQQILVHEFGHAVGLVNNGVPARSAHQDSAHGTHCTNERCVMNYSNEGAAAARTFALRIMSTRDTTMYDQACLDDAHAMIASSR